jgi:hypothetical protein
MGVSQEELAFRAKLHRTYVSGVERGVRNPTVRCHCWSFGQCVRSGTRDLARYKEQAELTSLFGDSLVAADDRLSH